MKIQCEIIRDILPLYAEDMVSQPTKELVEGHLAECEGCTEELENLRKPQKLPVETDASGLKRVGESIRRRRVLAVMAVLLFVGTLLIGGALLLDARIYFSATEAVKDIQVDGNEVHITWNSGVTGTFSAKDGKGNYAVTAWTNLYKWLFPKEKVPYEQLEDEVKALITKEQYDQLDNISTHRLDGGGQIPNFVYVDPRSNSITLLLDSGNLLPEKPLMQIDFYKAYYTAAMALLGVLIFLIGRRFGKTWYGEATQRIGILCGCLAVSAVVVNAGQFASINTALRETIIDSTAVAVPMCLCALCIRQLILLNRQDRGL